MVWTCSPQTRRSPTRKTLEYSTNNHCYLGKTTVTYHHLEYRKSAAGKRPVCSEHVLDRVKLHEQSLGSNSERHHHKPSQTFPCFPITVHGVQLLKINIRVSKPLARCLWPSVTTGQWFRAENGKLRSLRGKSGILGRCYLWMRSNVSWRHRKKTVDTFEPVKFVCITGDFTYFHWNNKGQSQRKSLEPLK